MRRDQLFRVLHLLAITADRRDALFEIGRRRGPHTRRSGNLIDESLRRRRAPLGTDHALAARMQRQVMVVVQHIAIGPVFVQMAPRA